MNALWTQHKNFVLAVAGGLFLFLVVESWTLGILAGAASTRSDTADLAARLSERAELLMEEEGRELGRRSALAGRLLPAFRRRMEYEAGPAFQLPQAEPNPGFYLRKRIGETAREVEESAGRTDMKYPEDLGFAEDLQGLQGEDGLLALAMTRDCLLRAAEARVLAVEELRFLGIESLPLFMEDTSRRAEDLHVRRARLRIAVRGDWSAMARFLETLSRRAYAEPESGDLPSFLALVDADLASNRDGLTGVLTVAALRVAEGPAETRSAEGRPAGAANSSSGGDSMGPKPIRPYRPR